MALPAYAFALFSGLIISTVSPATTQTQADPDAGADPHRSERRWFLERTRDLRAQLSSRAVVKTMHAVLEAIWTTVGIDFAERKRRTFALSGR